MSLEREDGTDAGANVNPGDPMAVLSEAGRAEPATLTPNSEPAGRRVRRAVTRAGVHAFEAAYEPGARLPEHGHAAPFFTYVLSGDYVERAGRHMRECRRGAVIFHDHESHANLVGPGGTASLNVEIAPELWRELIDNFAAVRNVAGRVLTGDIEWLALRVWREFQQPDTNCALGMDEAIVQLCAAVQNSAARGLFEPHERLDRCMEYLDAHLMESNRLADVAHIAGVHPMHLAKLFRRRFRYSMGEYVRRRRIAWACGHLTTGHDTITSIAQRAGFADHAHFTRTFTRIVGCTPRWYRDRVRGTPADPRRRAS